MQFHVDIQQSHLLKPNENCMSIKMSVSEPELGIFYKKLWEIATQKEGEGDWSHYSCETLAPSTATYTPAAV